MSKFRLLILSLYYPPDFSAGAFRTGALAKALSNYPNLSVEVTVLTAKPHRYPGSLNEMEDEEELTPSGRIILKTVDMPTHDNSMLSQIWAYLFYIRFVLREMGKGEFDGVYATSSRLLTGVLGAWVSKRLGKPFYLDLRDIFVPNLAWLLPRFPSKLAQIFFGLLERYAVSRASSVSVTSSGYLPYLERHYTETRFKVVTNGVDEFFASGFHSKVGVAQETLPELLYAGNIGAAQGVETIVPMLAKHFKGRFTFRVVGSGARVGALQTILSKEGLDNVTLEGPLPRTKLLERYSAASVLLITLNDHASLRMALPSKVFELAATGKPILARVTGYSSDFIAREIENAAQFKPEKPTDAIDALESLRIEQTDRKEFINKFRRDILVADHVTDILGALRSDKAPVYGKVESL